MNNTTLKILVFDHHELDQAAARAQFEHHDLTVVSKYSEAQKLLSDNSDFDVVLCDLMGRVPNPIQDPEERHLDSSGTPLGMLLAFMAAGRGVPYVGVLTAEEHVDHIISLSLFQFKSLGHPASLQSLDFRALCFKVNETAVAFGDGGWWLYFFDESDLARPLTEEEWRQREHRPPLRKNWAGFLESFLKA